ncbi:MAG: hypothetical protein PHI86_04835 [Candidatus Omnitrophica bacterium]|nr:hypothetical protein [Candidatus Omnitrophota bacterium]HOX54774.1 hypothetical protein [Candidatus Omnitrophota bacterium]
MKISKIGIAVLLASILVFVGSSLCQAADMTKGELASILVNKLGITMPNNTDNLSDSEIYAIQSKLLAERGITLFSKAGSNWKVFSCDLANVLYDALVGPNQVSIQAKFDYLTDKGYMAANPDYKCEIMNADDVLSILNIPELSSAIAQAYSAPNVFGTTGAGPGEVAGGGAGIPPAPENPEMEGIASPI